MLTFALALAMVAAPATNDDRDRQALWVLTELWIFFREELQSLPEFVRRIITLIDEECQSEDVSRKVSPLRRPGQRIAI